MAKPIDRETVERVLCAAYFNCWGTPYGSKVCAAHVDAVLETVNRSDHRGQHDLSKPVRVGPDRRHCNGCGAVPGQNHSPGCRGEMVLD